MIKHGMRLLIVAIALSPMFALAQPVTIYIHSFADHSCGAWVKSSKSRDGARNNYIAWFRGFLTGHNFASPHDQIRDEEIPREESLILYVDKFCRDNPLNAFAIAGFMLIEEIKENRKR